MRMISFRGDLAGLLVVLIVATYENCVKDNLFLTRIVITKFGDFTSNHFDRLNSLQLENYAGKSTHQSFKRLLSSRKKRIQNFTWRSH